MELTLRESNEVLLAYCLIADDMGPPDRMYISEKNYYLLIYPKCRYKPRLVGQKRKRRQK